VSQYGLVFHAEPSTAHRIVAVQYLGDDAGEGIIDGTSLNGSYMTGNGPVSIGIAPVLHMFVPGDPEPLLIDLATVILVKGTKFWVAFDTPKVKVAERITRVISMLIKT
jgi:hypothetical protein